MKRTRLLPLNLPVTASMDPLGVTAPPGKLRWPNVFKTPKSQPSIRTPDQVHKQPSTRRMQLSRRGPQTASCRSKSSRVRTVLKPNMRSQVPCPRDSILSTNRYLSRLKRPHLTKRICTAWRNRLMRSSRAVSTHPEMRAPFRQWAS